MTERLTIRQKKQILHAIESAEHKTSGELRVHLSYSKEEPNLLESAQARFQELKMDQTRDRNGILLYLNPRLHRFSIYGDIGIHEKVGQAFWEDLVQNVRNAIREKNLTHGIIHAIEAMGRALKMHFPHQNQDLKNELENDVSESD